MASKAGECPNCGHRFDHQTRIPYVSVVCGHSVCSLCLFKPAHVDTSTRHQDDDNASMSSSSSDGDEELVCQLDNCPVCNRQLAGFVKNMDAIAALEAESFENGTGKKSVKHPPPDLGSVVQRDLVIRREDIQFRRLPHDEIGMGASAIVYKGVYKNMPVAVKCIRTMSDSWANEDRLRRELRNASRLKNEHIVEFRGAAWDHEPGQASPRNVLLVTELMSGGDLRQSLNNLTNSKGLALESFVQIALQVTRGIEYLHAEGLAHRDIKSANILLTQRLQKDTNRFSKDVRAKIADFGLSKYIDKATGGGTVMQSIMEPGRLEATYAYLAPEAFGGDKGNVMRQNDESDEEDQRYDEMAKKRDIYALGVLFWEMLTGQIPWAGVPLPDVYVRVCVRSDRPGPALEDTKVSKSVRRLVDRCWSQNPTRRPSARSIAAKLEKIARKIGMTDESISPPMPSESKSTTGPVGVEALSAVSGQVPNARPRPLAGVGAMPDLYSEPLKEYPSENRDLHQDSLAGYHKMPSASTVYTAHNDGSKTHSTTGFEAIDAKDNDRIVEDIPGHFDDTVWVEDAESNKNSTGRQPSRHASNGALHTNKYTTAHARGLSSSKGNLSIGDTADTGPSSLNRRQARGRHPVDMPEVLQNRVHPSILAAHYSGVSQNPGLTSANNSKQNANATAVAATAAAIAAAKDRERKRDDIRGPRGPTSRVTRPLNSPSGVGNTVGDTSFQSLPSTGEPWQRGIAKERVEPRAMFYDNSDEEAEDFDPERAAAEEAMAQSNHHHIAQVTTSRSGVINARHAPNDPQRSASMNRVHRPKSPMVRRPVSPLVTRKHASTRIHDDDDGYGKQSSGNVTKGDHSQSKRNGLSVSTSRSRLSRTMSASAQTNAQQSRAAPMLSSSGVQAALASSESTTGRRAFIRRLRSGESPRRIARSTSTTGVDKKRPTTPGPTPTKHASNPTDTTINDEEDVEYTVVQIGASPKEDFQGTVNALDKAGVIHLFGQKMLPLRLAALANATLLSPKHRNEEELLRNSCAILHRLTVPSAAPQQSKNNGQDISSKDQLSIRKYLKSGQGVEALLQAMHPPRQRHPTTLSYALLALGNLTAWDLDSLKQFRNSQGVIQITQVMKAHIRNVGVQEKGCYALACVGAAYPPKGKTIFEEVGAVDVVIGALSAVKRENPNDTVTKQACAALGAMCTSCPPNALYAGKKDALSYLVAAFERFRQASRVDGGKRSEMRLVCKAFIDLLCHVENRKLAGSNGGSTMIIRAMRIFRLDPEFIEKGMATLSEFCQFKSNGMQIVQANGIDDIVAAMDRFKMNINMQKEGSRILSLLVKATGDQARLTMIHAGGAEAVIAALERFGAVPETNVAMVVEACRALHLLFQMENSSDAEILGRRMRKNKCDKAIKAALVAHRGNQNVHEKGKEALKQLSSLKSAGGIWGRMRSGQKKR